MQKRSKPFRFECAHRFVHLPASSLSDDASAEESSNHQSVTGPIYEMDDSPTVKLFTKKGCTLCDKVKDVRKMLFQFVEYVVQHLSYIWYIFAFIMYVHIIHFD